MSADLYRSDIDEWIFGGGDPSLHPNHSKRRETSFPQTAPTAKANFWTVGPDDGSPARQEENHQSGANRRPVDEPPMLELVKYP